MTIDPARTFRVVEERSDGLRVSVVITVPDSVAWKDVREVAEIAQMTASRAMTDACRSEQTCKERPPF